MTQPDGAPGLPSCYRHPGQVTGLRCTRCGRPICGECAIAAPVGFQCPECVHAASATQRQPTTVAGGSPISAPVVTYTLIAINVVVFGLQWLGGINAVAGDYGMWPVGIAVNGEWWRLGTAAFLHGSPKPDPKPGAKPAVTSSQGTNQPQVKPPAKSPAKSQVSAPEATQPPAPPLIPSASETATISTERPKPSGHQVPAPVQPSPRPSKTHPATTPPNACRSGGKQTPAVLCRPGT